jgi:hypothetical protein
MSTHAHWNGSPPVGPIAAVSGPSTGIWWLIGGLMLLAGFATSWIVLGPKVMNPSDLGWLASDPATHYLGWAFFRQSEEWLFPLTWTGRWGYPWGLSVSFTDSIPGLALLFRLLSDWLPESFQYLGLYATALIIGQGVIGLLLLRRLGFSNAWMAALGGCFFMVAPAFLWRFHGHIPLASHLLVLAALVACLGKPSPGRAPMRDMALLWLILLLATSVNPYITVLCLAVAITAIARWWLLSNLSLARALVLSCSCGALVLAGFVAFGFIIPGDVSNFTGGGYRYYSMNLLAPIDPQQFGGLLYGALPMAISGQYEGYNYLGLGILLLLAAGLLTGRLQPLMLLRRRDLWPVVALGLVCTLAAASATIALGGRVLVEIPLPRHVEAIAGMFRSSGRLFWPAYYLLMIGSLIWLRTLRPVLAVPVLAVALLIQAADTTPLIRSIRTVTHAQVDSPLRSPEWAALGAQHAHLAVHPAWLCGFADSPGGYQGFATFGLYATQHRMTLNSYYAGRTGNVDRHRHCRQALGPVLAGQFAADTLYVMTDALFARLPAQVHDSGVCRSLDDFVVCTDSSARP